MCSPTVAHVGTRYFQTINVQMRYPQRLTSKIIMINVRIQPRPTALIDQAVGAIPEALLRHNEYSGGGKEVFNLTSLKHGIEEMVF